ncbi:4Fe-4S binding protein [Ruminiclostridium josui]|uniref:4Fe-4S binding protein n=1 Tax=Ruminiclostridium josui TaxID=1499 RepID=UPI0004654BB5|nr:4Fe-4S binding protein [Ruminiclostridium josui]
MKKQKLLNCLLGPVATKFDNAPVGNWKTVKPVINNGKCIMCRQCEEYCPTGIISIDNENKISIDYNFCKGCGICANICRKNYILMVKNE